MDILFELAYYLNIKSRRNRVESREASFFFSFKGGKITACMYVNGYDPLRRKR